MATRAELIGALGERYRIGDRGEKTHIIDEFVAVTGYHRKHAMRVLRHGEGKFHRPRSGRAVFTATPYGKRWW